MGAPLGADMPEGVFSVAQTAPRVFFKPELRDAGFVGKLD